LVWTPGLHEAVASAGNIPPVRASSGPRLQKEAYYPRQRVPEWKNTARPVLILITRKIERIHKMRKPVLGALAALLCFAGASMTALADDHPYSEGPIVNVASIRTMEGKFDEYMTWLSTVWKKMQEESKKKGYILDYEVLGVEARGPDDPDIYLVITYKNWAALDGAIAKGDEIAKAAEGSLAAANKSQSERDKIRRVLGSQTMQQLVLK